MPMSEDAQLSAKPNRWRPVITGFLLFIVVLLLDLYLTANVTAESRINYFRLVRVAIPAVSIAWIVQAQYRINSLKRDVLTGLYRRMVAEEKLEELRLAKKDVTIAIIDVNGLRLVNNTHGHDHGDQLLKEVGHRLHSQFSFSRIIVARLGGDEFIVVAEHKSQQTLCDELTSCLSKPHPFGDWFIASAGVARSRTGQVRDALRCADRAMYRAKKTDAKRALEYDCVLDGIPKPQPKPDRPSRRLRDERIV